MSVRIATFLSSSWPTSSQEDNICVSTLKSSLLAEILGRSGAYFRHVLEVSFRGFLEKIPLCSELRSRFDSVEIPSGLGIFCFPSPSIKIGMRVAFTRVPSENGSGSRFIRTSNLYFA